MLPEQARKANISVGIALVLQAVGFVLSRTESPLALLGTVMVFVAIPLWVWGCMNYAEGKGHSKWLGFLGIIGIIGLIVLVLLPDRYKAA